MARELAQWIQPADPTQGGAVARAEFVVVQAAVFFAPFLVLRPPGILLTLSDGLFMLSLFLRVAAGTVPLRPFGSGSPVWIGGLVLLTSGLLIGSCFNGDALRGLVIVAQYDFAWFFLPLAVMCRPIEQTDRLIRCGIYSMVVICWIGLLFYYTDLDFGVGTKADFDPVTGNGRLSSLLNDANTLAGLIGLAIPLLAYTFSRKGFGIVTAAVCFVTYLVTVVLTSSNGGMLLFAGVMGILFIGRVSLRNVIIVGVVGVVGAVVLTQWGQELLPEVFMKRVGGALDNGDLTQAGTFNFRLNLMREAWAMADQYLLVGAGADQFRILSAYGAPVHNLYLLLLDEGSLVSLLGVFLIFTTPLVTALTQPEDRQSGLHMLTALAAMFAIAFFAMTIPHMYARFFTLPLILAASPMTASIEQGVRQLGRMRAKFGSPSLPLAPTPVQAMGLRLREFGPQLRGLRRHGRGHSTSPNK